jgi:hypothetical protein
VAVQFPSGAVVREQVGGSGVAVLAALAPRGSDLDTSVYASAVADSPSQVTSSLEFLVGGPLAVVDPAGDSSPGASRSTSGGGAGGSSQAGSTGFASCMSTSFLAPLSPQSAGSAGPPAPLVAAGDVVGAFEQAYDVNPLLGLAWNFSAVDLGSQLGCPVESISGLGSASASHADGLAVPQVEVQAVEFSGPASAVVVYQRGDGLLETGTATIADGTWKVSRSTYCRDIGSQ